MSMTDSGPTPEEIKPPRKKRVVKPRKPKGSGNKTLAAALVAATIAAVDLYMTVRLGIKLF